MSFAEKPAQKGERERKREAMELTEFEESVSFDLDDPDFAPPVVPRTTAHGVFRGMKFAAEIALNVNKCESLSPIIAFLDFTIESACISTCPNRLWLIVKIFISLSAHYACIGRIINIELFIAAAI